MGACGSTITSGGGDVAAADFSNHALHVIEQLKAESPIIVSGVSFDVYFIERKFKETFVHSVIESLSLNGNAVTAVNYPDKNEIIINRKLWLSLADVDKTQIAIHELIGLSYPQVSDANYIYSNALLKIVLSKESSQEEARWDCQCFENAQSGAADAGVTLNGVSTLEQALKKAQIFCQGEVRTLKVVAQCIRYSASD